MNNRVLTLVFHSLIVPDLHAPGCQSRNPDRSEHLPQHYPVAWRWHMACILAKGKGDGILLAREKKGGFVDYVWYRAVKGRTPGAYFPIVPLEPPELPFIPYCILFLVLIAIIIPRDIETLTHRRPKVTFACLLPASPSANYRPKIHEVGIPPPHHHPRLTPTSAQCCETTRAHPKLSRSR